MPSSEAECVQPLGLVGLQQSQACSDSSRSPGQAPWPASVRFCSEELSEAKSLRALLLRACPDLRVLVGRAASGRRCWALVLLASLRYHPASGGT